MNATTTHNWTDPFLTRCVVVLAQRVDSMPDAHAEIVATCLQRYGRKPIYYRDIQGDWCELMHDGTGFVTAAPPESAYTTAKLKQDFPVQ